MKTADNTDIDEGLHKPALSLSGVEYKLIIFGGIAVGRMLQMLWVRAFCCSYATGSSFSSPAFAVDGPHSIVASCQKQLQTGSRPLPSPLPHHRTHAPNKAIV